MLVPFVIDADSLSPDPAWTEPAVRQCHRDLLDVWQRIGLLVHDGESFDASRLSRAIECLPQKLRMLWQAALGRSPPVPCGNGWAGAVTPGSTEEIGSIASLALVDDTHAEVDFGMEDEQDETLLAPGNVHPLVIARLLAANHASVVQDALAISQRNIDAGERYQDIWAARFRFLASAPSPSLKTIAIVDRYAIEQHFRCPQQWLSGLERFLRLLDDDAEGPRYVRVYSAWTAELQGKSIHDIKKELKGVMDRLPKKNVRRLMPYMVPNSVFGDAAHDRYIRFGRYIWELGRGVEIFQGPAAAHLCQASFKSEAYGHQRLEEQLERESTA